MANKLLLSASLEYLNQGLSIIPTNGKVPLVKWKKFQTQHATKREVRWWFSNLNPSGIAIITGEISDIVVIDIDPKNGGDISILSNHTPTVISGSGGKHLYYKPNTTEDLQSLKTEGYDVQGNGSCAVAPPSAHKSGQLYAWNIPFDRETLKPFPVEFKKTILPPPSISIPTHATPRTNKIKQFRYRTSHQEAINTAKNTSLLQVVKHERFQPKQIGTDTHSITCPFHSDNTPSCIIYTETNRMHCYGCGIHLDSIAFIQKYHNLDFVSACHYLQQNIL